MKLITISGLDGSGKSTQIQMLKEYLEKQGQTVEYFHIINFSIANKILTRGKEDKKNSNRAVSSANFLQVFLRKLAIIIDIFRFRNYFLMLSRKNKIDYLLSDRFFYDQIINIFYLQGKETKKTGLTNFLQNYLISPDLKIYLKVAPGKIITRKRGIEQGLDYLKKKSILYDAFCQSNDFQIINGEKDKKSTNTEIIKILKQLK